MKKVLLLLAVAAMLVTGSDLFAGGVMNNSNMSAEYIRSFTRNGATDAADIAFYNPAGLVKLKDGLSINFSNQSVLSYPWTAYSNDGIVAAGGEEEYKSDEPIYFIPNLYLSYKQENWASFLSITVPGGGGDVKFKDGVPMFIGAAGDVQSMVQQLQSAGLQESGYTETAANTIAGATSVTGVQDPSAEVSEMTPAVTVGGSFSVNEMLSIALGARVVKTINSVKAKATYSYANSMDPANPLLNSSTPVELDSKQTGWGYGGVIGFNFDLEGVNVGVKYESLTRIELKNDTSKDDLGMYPDGKKYRNDLPASINLGAAITVTPELALNLHGTYYFEKQADWDGAQNRYDNSWEAAVSVEYKVTPTMLVSVGYNYTNTGGNEDTLNDFDFDLDSHSLGLGMKFSASEDLDVNAAFSTTRYVKSPESKNANAYDPATDSGNQYLQSNYMIALGVNYRLAM